MTIQWNYFHVLDTPYTLMYYRKYDKGNIYLVFCWMHHRVFAVEIRDEDLEDGHIWEAAWNDEFDVPEEDLRWFAEEVLRLSPEEYEISWECDH